MASSHPLALDKAQPAQPALDTATHGAQCAPPPPPAAPGDAEPSIHAAAQRGDVALIDRLVKDGKATVDDRDEQNVTPLHWAAINAQLAACRYLLDHGADVDALGGDLVASPLQWAARNGHLYIMHLLVAHGADPSITDAQGFNTLHLVTHSSMVMPLLYTLQQPVAVDARDLDGHTALMWAAYQGDAISISLLLKHHASPTTSDAAGLTPLHWAVVKGNLLCLRLLLEAGGDVGARDGLGKSVRDMAGELRSEAALDKALKEAGLGPDGQLKKRRFGERTTRALVFLLPVIAFSLVSSALSIFPWYSGPFLALGVVYGMHHLITKTILDPVGPPSDALAKSPYFAAVISMSMAYVLQCWLTRVAYTPGHTVLNVVFLASFALCVASFYKAATLDPGFVPLPSGEAEIKDTIEDLTSRGQLNGTTFDIVDMVRKPLRSKHCRITDRCVARFDHYCPWVWNAVGAGNHRQFLVFVASLIVGIISFDALSFYYFVENAPTWTPETGASCVLPAPLCTASGYDTHLFLVTAWASLQLTWTVILLASQGWQVARQLTTLEVSNLGRYGFMGGRGGASLKDQSGALASLGARAGGGMQGVAGPGGVPLDPNDVEDGVDAPPPPVGLGSSASTSLASHSHTHAHGHSHGTASPGVARRGRFTFCLQILGLDQFTRGKAARGLKMAGRDANPFDMGVLANCFDFWTMGGGLDVDYRFLYDIPSGGFTTSKQPLKISLPSFSLGSSGGGRGYQPVRQSGDDV